MSWVGYGVYIIALIVVSPFVALACAPFVLVIGAVTAPLIRRFPEPLFVAANSCIAGIWGGGVMFLIALAVNALFDSSVFGLVITAGIIVLFTAMPNPDPEARQKTQGDVAFAVGQLLTLGVLIAIYVKT